MGNKQSSTTQDEQLVSEKQLSGSDGNDAEAGKDPMQLLQAQNDELQDQLASIRVQAQQSKEREQAFVRQWEACIETLKVQVKTSGEELTSAQTTVTEQAMELETVRQQVLSLQKSGADQAAAAQREVFSLRQAAADQATAAQQEVQELRKEHESTILQMAEQHSQEVSRLREEHRGAITEKTQEASAFAAKAAQLEVEVAAAQEDAAAAGVRSKAATEREARAVHQRMLAESAQKSMELALSAAEARAAAVTGDANSAQEAAVERATARATKIQHELQAKTQELAVALQTKDEVFQEVAALRLQLDTKTKELAAALEVKTRAQVNGQDQTKQLQQELTAALKAKAQAEIDGQSQTKFLQQELDATLKAKEQAVDEVSKVRLSLDATAKELSATRTELKIKMEEVTVPTPHGSMVQEELQLKMRELATAKEDLNCKVEELLSARTAEADAKRQCEELRARLEDDAPPLKKAKTEPGLEQPEAPVETRPEMGMQDEQVQLLLGEMERMQEEKKKRDKVLKEFKQLKKVSVEQFVESLMAESEANKVGGIKAKGKAATPVTDPKKRQAATPATDSGKRQK